MEEKARVLVVEDEGIIALNLKRKLEKIGYIVTSIVPSSEEAILKAETDKPDIIMMDIVIQGEMDGIDTAAEIKKRSDIPIIFMTAYADDKLLERAKLIEPYGYIVKASTNDKEICVTLKMALYKHKMETYRKSSEYKDMLLKEIHHRVKNNFQLITSLLSLQSEAIEDETLRNVFIDSFNRIRTMSMIHTKLYQSADLSTLDFAEYVQELCAELVNSYEIHSNTPAIKLDINIKRVDITTAIPCGLIINELISNSMKYAFKDGRQGAIFVSLNEDDSGNYVLITGDNGVGIPEGFDLSKARSLGMQLVHDLVKRKLKGTIDIDTTNGTTYRMVFKKTTTESV
ncbi:histidine kinase dimerization/phosphoacceptor domain -containing protein [Candidatus Magnetomonas plexicatena]|uniref:histidine kinase dimerization/phosphoacceptor domain -containing protein n=1 Tax=Candidatus Magnetomonas plexicatena TaxID=2552947 RepID=UPI00110538C4|nr:response regulator [Nitrospirales bacterium LBB_01]